MNEVTELFGYLTGDMAVPLINSYHYYSGPTTSIVPAISHAFAKLLIMKVFMTVPAGSMRLTFMATVPFTVLLYVLAAPTVTLIYNAPKAELAYANHCVLYLLPSGYTRK